MDVIDRIQQISNYLKSEGIEIRYEDLNGVPSGLCCVNGRRMLMIELTLPSSEQLEYLEETASAIKRNTSKSVA